MNINQAIYTHTAVFKKKKKFFLRKIFFGLSHFSGSEKIFLTIIKNFLSKKNILDYNQEFSKYRKILDSVQEKKFLMWVQCTLLIRSGHTALKSQLHKLNLCETNVCDCNNEIQTIRHIIMNCPNLSSPRKELFDTVDKTYNMHNTPIFERQLTLEDLIWPQHSCQETSTAVSHALQVFLRHCSI